MTGPVGDVNGLSMIPLRDICDIMGCEVVWNAATKTAQINVPTSGGEMKPL